MLSTVLDAEGGCPGVSLYVTEEATMLRLPPALNFAWIGKVWASLECRAQPTQLYRAVLRGVGVVALIALRTSFRSPHSPKCSNEAVLVATFHPTDPTVLITCGKSHIYFWNLEGGGLSKRQGLFEVSARGAGMGQACRRRAGSPRQTAGCSRGAQRLEITGTLQCCLLRPQCPYSYRGDDLS